MNILTTNYSGTSITTATNTTAVYAPFADKIAYQVVASAASSPTGATIRIQGSMDGTNWYSLDSTVSVTGNGTFTHHLTGINTAFLYYRLSYAISSGSYTATTTLVIKED